MRVEVDELGPVEVPDDALFGVHTVRALKNFPGPWPRVADRPELLRSLAHVKAAAAEANAQAGVIDECRSVALCRAADEIVAGRWHEQFPLSLIQGGGGTATNMAMNEVLANRAAELLGGGYGSYDLVHPLDHANRSQSTNDVYPTAVQLATLSCLAPALAGLDAVARALDGLAERYPNLERLGRTCLRDAVPLPVHSYHAAQAKAVRRAAAGLSDAAEALLAIPLGATAVGTGLGASEVYRQEVVARLAARTGFPLRSAPDLFDALAHLDPLLATARATATAAITLAKVASDLRFLSSGPFGGIAEVHLPVVQAGSSIMPGKINPVIPELVLQASFEIRAAAYAVELVVASGELDLNVMEPVAALHVPDALAQLAATADVFAAQCLNGVEWDEEQVERHLVGSLKSAVEQAALSGHDTVRSDRLDPPNERSDGLR